MAGTPIAPVSVTAGNDQADLQNAQNVGQAIVAKASGPVGYGAGQNPFTAAANNVDVQKAAMLKALAQGGSAGRSALDSANAALAAQRQGAIQGALTAAATRGVNGGLGNAQTGMQSAIAGQVGSPGQQYGADLAGAARDFTENNAFLQQGFNQYGQEAKAAVPVIEANTQNALQAARMNALAKLASEYQSGVTKAQLAADTAKANQDLKGIELQIAGANLSKAQTEQGTAGINEQKAADTASGSNAKTVTITVKAATPGQPGIPGSTYGVGPNGIRNPGQAAVPGTPAQTVTVPNTPAGIRSTTGPLGYGQAMQDALRATQPSKQFPSGMSESQIENSLLGLGYDPLIVNQVMSDIRGNFTTNPNGGARTGQ